jgi:hypothetical protein
MNGCMLRTLASLAAACALASCQKPRLSRILPADHRIDVFPQSQQAQLDALFVVDNGKFMAPHQQKLGESFHVFLDYLTRNQIDFHIGLLTTDVGKSPGQFQGGGDKHYFASTDGDLATQIAAAVEAFGDQGSPVSPSFQQLDLALRNPPAGYLRTRASLFLVSVSNDDDSWSTAPDLYYYRTFKEAKGFGNDGLVTFSALAGDVPNGCRIPDPNNPGQSFFSGPAPRLMNFATGMGGLFHSICDPSFDVVFDQLSATAAGLKRTFRLAKIPDQTTLTVDIRVTCDINRAALGFCTSIDDQCGQAQPAQVCTPKQGADGWTFDAPTNSIVFAATAVPPRASLVEVEYKDSGASP